MTALNQYRVNVVFDAMLGEICGRLTGCMTEVYGLSLAEASERAAEFLAPFRALYAASPGWPGAIRVHRLIRTAVGDLFATFGDPVETALERAAAVTSISIIPQQQEGVNQ